MSLSIKTFQFIFYLFLTSLLFFNTFAQSNVQQLIDWKFHKGDISEASETDFNDKKWKISSFKMNNNDE